MSMGGVGSLILPSSGLAESRQNTVLSWISRASSLLSKKPALVEYGLRWMLGNSAQGMLGIIDLAHLTDMPHPYRNTPHLVVRYGVSGDRSPNPFFTIML